MKRRSLLVGAGSAIAASLAGCLGSASDGPPTYDGDDHGSHLDEFEAEIERRAVVVDETEYDDGVAAVGYESTDLNQDLAEVTMAFVERVQGGWSVDRLDAVAYDASNVSWQVKTEWAEQYLDDEIDADELGALIGGTIERAIVLEGDE